MIFFFITRLFSTSAFRISKHRKTWSIHIFINHWLNAHWSRPDPTGKTQTNLPAVDTSFPDVALSRLPVTTCSWNINCILRETLEDGCRNLRQERIPATSPKGAWFKAVWFPTRVPRNPGVSFTILLQYSGVPRGKTIFNISLRIHFQNSIKLLKQVAMGSPLGAASYIFQGATTLKKLGNTDLKSRLLHTNNPTLRCYSKNLEKKSPKDHEKATITLLPSFLSILP